MLDREPFLRAIFAAPDDDLPRLVFADYLDEQGDHAWAELIRVQCELAHFAKGHDERKASLVARELELLAEVYPREPPESCLAGGSVARGFRQASPLFPAVRVTADELFRPDHVRVVATSQHPEWYGYDRLDVTEGRITSADQLATLLTSPVTARVTEFELAGHFHDAAADPGLRGVFADVGLVRPAITGAMVAVLCQMPEVRRVVELDLRLNDLDNDAARAVVRSPHLHRLERLRLLDGNRFRGRVWQQVLERFGAEVAQ